MMSMLLCTAMAAGLLMGCGSKPAETTAAATAATEAATTAAAEAASTEAATEAAATEAVAAAAEALPGGGSKIMYIITPSHSNPFFFSFLFPP